MGRSDTNFPMVGGVIAEASGGKLDDVLASQPVINGAPNDNLWQFKGLIGPGKPDSNESISDISLHTPADDPTSLEKLTHHRKD